MKNLLKIFNDNDLGAYIYKKAKSGSIYIKFANKDLGSLRIADHEGRSKYRYRWNLRSDLKASYNYRDRGVVRYYYVWSDLQKLVQDLLNFKKEDINMSWMTNENNPQTELKPHWLYRDGMEFVTILPGEIRDFALIQGDLDPTRTWNGPMSVWVHEFKGISGSFVTVICNKWNEACPFCYENELYKASNPNYKNSGGRLPHGLSNKALIQVYDIKYNKVCWLLAGKRIQEGMDFVLQNFQHNFKGFVSISRTGQRLNTTYRVDLFQGEIPDMSGVQDQIVSLDDVPGMIYLSHQEVYEKSGINPYTYFQNKMSSGPVLDISKWGPIPHENKIIVSQQQAQQPPVQQASNQQPPASQAPPVQQPPPVPNKEVVVLPADLQGAVDFVCISGVYNGQKMSDVINQTGKPYIQFLSRSGMDEEKKIAQVLLDNWDKIQEYLDSLVPF